MSTQNRRVLLVDDLPSIHEDFRKILDPPAAVVDLSADEMVLFGDAPKAARAIRFEMQSAYQGMEALEQVRSACSAGKPFAVAFLDMRMPPGWDGVETAARLWAVDPALQIVFCTAYSDYAWSEVLVRLEARDRLLILKKPCDPIEVYQFAHALTTKWQSTENAAFRMSALEEAVEKRTEELERSREMFRLMAESTKAVPFTLDITRGFFSYIGSQAIADSGVAESQWKSPGGIDIVIPRDANPEVRQRLENCEPGPFEFVASFSQHNGERRTEVRWTGTCELLAGAKVLRGLMLDITEVRRLGRELAAAQKLESIGRLAAGIAHEINTPVQYVWDSVEFVRTSIREVAAVITAYRNLMLAVHSRGDAAAAAILAAEAEKQADLDYVIANVPNAVESSIEGLSRIAAIVRSMKEFAHPDQADKKLADLNQAIRSTLIVAHNEYKYVAEIDTQLGELPPVPCFLGEFNQVVLNLLVNAAHAIADVRFDSGQLGKITVRTRLDGEFVEISIGDTGTGIPAGARDKIFDPFFTTKEVGKGTGQGLAIARSVIVNKHGGTLSFETELGRGTTFFIRLPLDAADAQEVAA